MKQFLSTHQHLAFSLTTYFPLKKLFLYGLCLLLLPSTFAQTQMGTDIDGEAAFDFFGEAVSFAADGSRLAVGAFSHNEGAGHTQVYDWNGTAWIQVGDDIDAEGAFDNAGFSVVLTPDGNRLAIGAPGNEGVAAPKGQVRVYDWNGTTSAWEQVGADIDGEAGDDQSGYSVSFSADGNRLAIGARFNDGSDGLTSAAGHVRVYDWNGSAWGQVGDDLDGEDENNLFGKSVSLSADGNYLAAGAPTNNDAGPAAGHARVFFWNGTAWTQVGADIDGDATNDQSGWSVSLSANGARLAVGSPNHDVSSMNSVGQVKVYDWSGTAWVQAGNDIEGIDVEDQFGKAVSLSADGTRLGIGASQGDDPSLEPGYAQVYIWNGSAWLQASNTLIGEGDRDLFGFAVALSGDGNRFAVGGYQNDGAADRAGHVRAFEDICDRPQTNYTYSDDNLEVDFTDMSTSSVGPITAWLWDFGDGNTSSLQNPSHAYPVKGTYLACLIVTNICGNDTLCQSIEISCPDPEADFSFITDELSVDFTDISISGPGAASWIWDFGDGNTSTQQNPTHTYQAEATYLVCLTVTDACETDSSCASVKVEECVLPSGFSNADIGNVSGNPGDACRAGGIYTVNTSGTGIKGTADGFHYVSKSHTGDIDMIVKVTGIQNNSSRQAGLMLRTGAGDNDGHVSLIMNGKKQLKLLKRTSTGGTTITTATKVGKKRVNLWLRLSYISATNTVTAYQSRTGIPTSWELVGTTFMTLPSTFEAGLAASKGATGGTKTFTFDNFSINGSSLRLSDAMNHVVIVAYPNPFRDELGYRLEGVEGDATVRLLDMTGRVVHCDAINHAAIVGRNNEGTLNTAEIAAGIYFLEVRAGNERKLVKVVKQ